MLINLDQLKAFDRIDHRFSVTVLETVGFELEFCWWLTFYTALQRLWYKRTRSVQNTWWSNDRLDWIALCHLYCISLLWNPFSEGLKMRREVHTCAESSSLAVCEPMFLRMSMTLVFEFRHLDIIAMQQLLARNEQFLRGQNKLQKFRFAVRDLERWRSCIGSVSLEGWADGNLWSMARSRS